MCHAACFLYSREIISRHLSKLMPKVSCSPTGRFERCWNALIRLAFEASLEVIALSQQHATCTATHPAKQDPSSLFGVCFHLIFRSGRKFLPHATLNNRISVGRNDLAAAPRLIDTGTLHRQHVPHGPLANRPLKIADVGFLVARHVAHPGLAAAEAPKLESSHVQICPEGAPGLMEPI
jgi:hypothetical protein